MYMIKIKQLIKRIIGYFTFYRYNNKSIVILNYHSVHPSHPLSTHPDAFYKQMQYLANNFNIISLSDLPNYMNKIKTSNSKSVIITFDDGYEDNYIYAYPILRKLNIKATIFTLSLDNSLDIWIFDDYGY